MHINITDETDVNTYSECIHTILCCIIRGKHELYMKKIQKNTTQFNNGGHIHESYRKYKKKKHKNMRKK